MTCLAVLGYDGRVELSLLGLLGNGFGWGLWRGSLEVNLVKEKTQLTEVESGKGDLSGEPGLGKRSDGSGWG